MNPMDLFKNVQELQGKLGEAQERIKKIQVTGSAGGDMVRITLTGDFQIVSVTVAPEVVDPADREMLQDLFRAAYNDASAKVKEQLQGDLSSLAGGFPMPPGLFG